MQSPFTPRTRREFLGEVGQGMLIASVGASLASDLGVAGARADEASDALTFGALEPLVALMQETPIERLQSALVERMRNGSELRTMVAAGALANARTFGGEDYIGFHTMMALAPAYHMALELPEPRRALPVLKVLYRNTNRIHEHGGRASEVLHKVAPADVSPGENGGELLREATRAKDVDRAERTFAALANGSAEDALNSLLYAVDDATEVHRVALPYRAYDLLGIIGPEHAHTLLRQSVRYCVRNEDRTSTSHKSGPRAILPKLFDEYHLAGKTPGDRAVDDAWIEAMVQTLFTSSPDAAAQAAAAALAEGISPAAVGEAICLAANQLVLRDPGRPARFESPGKPLGSVHGDSVGVHACDSANAWRNMALVGNPRNTFACLILGAYQATLDRVQYGGGDLAKLEPLPVARHVEQVTASEPDALLRELDAAVRGNLQSHASAITYRYGQLGHPPRGVFDVLLKYAISEDGALHAEKYYRTVSEEFAATRPAFRWRQLVALARVTASEYGRPAAGCEEARGLLKLA
ncbi:MAG: hypothetical protein AB7O59_14630 [Pirellulales bacterium]